MLWRCVAVFRCKCDPLWLAAEKLGSRCQRHVSRNYLNFSPLRESIFEGSASQRFRQVISSKRTEKSILE